MKMTLGGRDLSPAWTAAGRSKATKPMISSREFITMVPRTLARRVSEVSRVSLVQPRLRVGLVSWHVLRIADVKNRSDQGFLVIEIAYAAAFGPPLEPIGIKHFLERSRRPRFEILSYFAGIRNVRRYDN